MTNKTFREKKIEEFKDIFNEGTIFQTDNFEDPKGHGHPCYSHYGIAEAFEEFLSQALTDQIQEILEMEELKEENIKDHGKQWSVPDYEIPLRNQLKSQIKAAIKERFVK